MALPSVLLFNRQSRIIRKTPHFFYSLTTSIHGSKTGLLKKRKLNIHEVMISLTDKVILFMFPGTQMELRSIT
jgi:hypothetical protein